LYSVGFDFGKDMDAKLIAAIVACLLLGLRHGFDYDHLAAITDITAVQRSWKSGIRLGVTYALGHAFTVVALGVMVLGLHIGLPERLDHWTERLIGATLILLGAGVVAGLVRKRLHTHVHLESRLAAAVNGLLWFGWWVRRFFAPDVEEPKLFRWNYSGKSVFMIGVLHGIGAETPSQLALFFLTANLGGTSRGMMGLGAFAVGLILMNTLMTASLGGVFGASSPRPQLYKAIAWTGAAYSFIIGVIFLFGVSDRLPSLGGG
jgi:high-affinity nickel permease